MRGQFGDVFSDPTLARVLPPQELVFTNKVNMIQRILVLNGRNETLL
jgi:hypothetical protein